MSLLSTPGFALLAVASLASTSALASGDNVPQTASEKVSLADLDLTARDGVRMARKRVDESGRHLCTQLYGLERIELRTDYFACVQEAVASGEQQLDRLQEATAPGRVADAAGSEAR